MSEITPTGYVAIRDLAEQVGVAQIAADLAGGTRAAYRLDRWGELHPMAASTWRTEIAAEILQQGRIPDEWPGRGKLQHRGEAVFVKLPRSAVSPGGPRLPQQDRAFGEDVGRRRKYDWDGALIELARLNHEEGTAGKTQAELIKHLQNWFSRNSGSEPAKSEIQRRVARFMKAVG